MLKIIFMSAVLALAGCGAPVSSGECIPVEGGAQCCEDIAPTPDEIVCPEGSERDVNPVTGSVKCRVDIDLGDGRVQRFAGPFVSVNSEGSVSTFGSHDAGEEVWGCNVQTGLAGVRQLVTGVGDYCNLECWSEDGSPAECLNPCAE